MCLQLLKFSGVQHIYESDLFLCQQVKYIRSSFVVVSIPLPYQIGLKIKCKICTD